MTHGIAKAPERVLTTLDEEGHRIKIHPRKSPGRFWKRRGVVAYALIAVFVILPFVYVGGRPAILLDLERRELDLFGAVFRPSDGAVLIPLGTTVALTVFLVTALWGRVWCGWGCPQTVYMEWVFRPIERWIEGSPTEQKNLDDQRGVSVRRLLKYVVFALIAVGVANVFLAYFVGVERLSHWMLESPLEHPGGFGVVLAVSALMFGDFAWFREQTCIVACPYGRLQSVLLDRQSLVVGYDVKRGEPRGKVALKVVGDCVDCKACVATCPTGLDIRQGWQMECINCAQCIDACDAIMDKLGRPKGLVRYTTPDELDGKPRKVWRARTILYPVLLAISVGVLAWAGHDRPRTEVWVMRMSGTSFATLPDGRVSTQVEVQIENRTDRANQYTITLVDAPELEVMSPTAPVAVAAGASTPVMIVAIAPANAFDVHDERGVTVRVTDAAGSAIDVQATLFGPEEHMP